MRLVHTDTRLPSISVWLPTLTKPDAMKEQRSARLQDPTGSTRQRDANQPTDTTLTVEAAAPAANGVSLPTETVGPAEAQGPSAPSLYLELSRKDILSTAPRSFAEQSPFRGRLPKTVERQIASAAAETGPWTEERIDNDRIRFRRGNTCVMMQRPRAASIDPLNEASNRMPWRANVEECTD